MLVVKFILLLLSVFSGYILGFILTETKFTLSRYRVFQFKAFECRPCLSFHIAWVISTIIGLYFENYIMIAIGILFAFALFIGLKLDQQHRTITLEDLDIDNNNEKNN